MCLLWSTNWFFISQKTTFFIVTAVKTSNPTQADLLWPGMKMITVIWVYSIQYTVYSATLRVAISILSFSRLLQIFSHSSTSHAPSLCLLPVCFLTSTTTTPPYFAAACRSFILPRPGELCAPNDPYSTDICTCPAPPTPRSATPLSASRIPPVYFLSSDSLLQIGNVQTVASLCSNEKLISPGFYIEFDSIGFIYSTAPLPYNSR
jgi:hypothetical protein